MVIFSGILAVSLSYIFAGVMDVSTTAWSTPDARSAVIRGFINVLVATIGFGIFGMILGLLFRSPISAISIGVIWNLIIEGLPKVFDKLAIKVTDFGGGHRGVEDEVTATGKVHSRGD